MHRTRALPRRLLPRRPFARPSPRRAVVAVVVVLTLLGILAVVALVAASPPATPATAGPITITITTGRPAAADPLRTLASAALPLFLLVLLGTVAWPTGRGRTALPRPRSSGWVMLPTSALDVETLGSPVKKRKKLEVRPMAICAPPFSRRSTPMLDCPLTLRSLRISVSGWLRPVTVNASSTTSA